MRAVGHAVATVVSLLAVMTFFCQVSIIMPVAAAEHDAMLAESSVTTALTLGASPVSVTLKPPAAATAGLNKRLLALGGTDQVYLLLQGLQANAPVDASYDVYLNLPVGHAPARGDSYYIGNFNFFDSESGRRSAVFNVTDRLRSLAGADALGEQPTVTIVPSGHPDAAATPTIARVLLVTAPR